MGFIHWLNALLLTHPYIEMRPLVFMLCILSLASSAEAQIEPLWLDVGELHNLYPPSGASVESELQNLGMQWPAHLRLSGHTRSEAFWIGAKNWRNEAGEEEEYMLFLNGPRVPDNDFVVMDYRLVSRWPETNVLVHGAFGGRNNQVVSDVDPMLPADRMIVSRIRTEMGIEVERKAYAFSNPYHDDYHIIERTFTNTGNTDADDEIELPGQSVYETYFFNIWRWTGRLEASNHSSIAQQWGKFNMIDVVGDGNEEYPVDFTSIFSWAGYDPEFSQNNWNNLGSPMVTHQESSAPTDTTGRLAGMSMQGLMVLHADNSTTDASYDPQVQPRTLGFMDMDGFLSDGASFMDLYELGILSRENPDFVREGASRMYPHYADRIEPEGDFWNPSRDASDGKQGGFGATVAYGPYDMEINNQVRVVEAIAAGGLNYDSALHIGREYKRSGFDDEALIEYDANQDGIISDAPFDYSSFDTGAERLTKNQWFMTTRDSMLSTMSRAKEVWDQSNGLSEYLFDAMPAPPAQFVVSSTRDKVVLDWSTHPGEGDPEQWELYKTVNYLDNLPYELIATLPGSARSFEDLEVQENTAYFYYVQAVGAATSPDPTGITGTPAGAPFKSSRYYTQTYLPAFLSQSVDVPPIGALVGQNHPNPFNGSTSIPFAVNGPDFVKIIVVDVLGQEVISLVDRFFERDFADDIEWDGRDYSGKLVPNGVYFCQITTTLGRHSVPMVVVR